jgi:hypothetical protein
MTNSQYPEPPLSPLRDDIDAKLPAAAYLRYANRADGWSAGRQAACLAHLADNGLIADAVRSVGMSVGGSYALRRTARGYAFNLGWEAALIIARRIVADNLMTAAIKGEESRWVREDGVTTYTRQNTKLSLTLLDRVNPATALPEVLAVATRFDCFLQMIDDGLSAQELWDYFFDEVLPHEEPEARARVRAALLLSEDSAGFDEGDEGDDAPIEYKSMEGARRIKVTGAKTPSFVKEAREQESAAFALDRALLRCGRRRGEVAELTLKRSATISPSLVSFTSYSRHPVLDLACPERLPWQAVEGG